MNNELAQTVNNLLAGLRTPQMDAAQRAAMDGMLAFSRNEIDKKEMNARLKTLRAENKAFDARHKTLRIALAAEKASKK